MENINISNLTKENYEEFERIANCVYKIKFRTYSEHYEDLISNGIIFMYKYYNNYDDSKGARSTYLFNACKFGMLRFIENWYNTRRKDFSYVDEISLSTPLGENGDTSLGDLLPAEEFDFDSKINIDYIKRIADDLVEKIPQPTAKGKLKYLTKQKCIKLYLQYFDCSKVANILGISRQCVDIWVIQFRELFKDRLLKECYYG